MLSALGQEGGELHHALEVGAEVFEDLAEVLEHLGTCAANVTARGLPWHRSPPAGDEGDLARRMRPRGSTCPAGAGARRIDVGDA